MVTGVIRPIGDVLSVDAEGFLINPCHRDLIAPPWSVAVAAVVEAYRSHFGARLHSVYVRGSVAKGTAMLDVSDIDTFAVLHGEPEDADRSWVEVLHPRLAQDFPFQSGVELAMVSLCTVREDTAAWVWPFLIKTQSICLWGQDLAPTLPGFKPGPALASHALTLADDLQEFTVHCPEAGEARDGQDWCQWIMKRVVRAGFELTMARERTYTRDLYPCYAAFARHYPEQAPQMRQALQWAIGPTSDKATLAQFLDDFGVWMAAESAVVTAR
ncbi:MAG: nucleotidyltransferase [Ideonella sp. MAG2]|nr:MAG: nucleotidyltransferase [Ideonella sp. MAG2]